MRLKQRDIDAIKIATHKVFGDTAIVRLFGSRVHDDLRGGDIDLLIEADPSDRSEWQRIGAFRDALFRMIDEQKVDVVLVERGKPMPVFAQVVAPQSVVIQ